MYNHVQSVNIGVENLRRHVKEFLEGIKKPCPQSGKDHGIANMSRHIRQVHKNEPTKSPDCGKALTIYNLNKHIQSVHKQPRGRSVDFAMRKFLTLLSLFTREKFTT